MPSRADRSELRTWLGADRAGCQACAQSGLDAVAALELGGVAEAVLEVRELGQRAADEVMGAAARACEVLGELGEGPVLVEMQPAGLTLVLGEQGAVDVKEALLPRA